MPVTILNFFNEKCYHFFKFFSDPFIDFPFMYDDPLEENRRIYVCIYQPLHTSRMWLKVSFRRGLTGLNSNISFSLTGCLTKAKELRLPYYFSHSWWENFSIHAFSKDISATSNVISLVQGLNSGSRVHFLRTPPKMLWIYQTPPPWVGCNTRSSLNEEKVAWFPSFPSPRQVAILRLKFLFTHLLRCWQDVTQGQFLSRV